MKTTPYPEAAVRKAMQTFAILCLLVLLALSTLTSRAQDWGPGILVKDIPTFTDAGGDARGIRPGVFGLDYGRMLKLANGSWLAVYTIYQNNGYNHDPNGGTQLHFSRSTDNGRTWTDANVNIADPGRDLDNGQMIQLSSGRILLACRSVRWQESYRLPVYKSDDNGTTWSYLSTIDANNGTPGSLGNPDKGVYEPHLGLLPNGNVAVMYANEKHVTENPSYSQVISGKASPDGGATWGPEGIVAAEAGAARPGMPVWTRLTDGRYIAVYEVCGPQNCNVFYKFSSDGVNWPAGLGTNLPNQLGGPYVLSLSSGRLVVTSNSGNVSYSDNLGASWTTINSAWGTDVLWASLYQSGPNEVATMTSRSRPQGGHNIQVKGAAFLTSAPIVSGGVYRLSPKSAPSKAVEVAGASTVDNANIQQWDWNGGKQQQWRIQSTNDGYYRLVSANTRADGVEEVMGVDVCSGADGANVQQYHWLNNSCQRWRLTALPDGNYRLTPKSAVEQNLDKCLDVKNCSTDNNDASGRANVQQWQWLNSNCQHWILTLLSSSRLAALVTAPGTNAEPLRVFPNPATDKFAVQYYSAAAQAATIVVANTLGQVVQQKVMRLAEGNNQLELSAEALSSGLYLVKVVADGQQAMLKLEVVR